MPFQATHRVTSTSLNFRSEPLVRPGNRLAVLPSRQPVAKLLEHPNGWWQVGVQLHGAQGEGFVASRFLEPAPLLVDEPGPAAGSIPSAHMGENRPHVTRQNAGSRAFPLGEPGRPSLTSSDRAARAAELSAILDWLDVEHSPRYLPTSRSTFCNIYAYDVAYLSGAYLPRVWWTGTALLRLQNGENVPVIYGETVQELNANSLLVWLSDFGPSFGWRRTLSLDELQRGANDGGLGVLVARHEDINRSGHIAVVERESDDLEAARDSDGVTRPITSQAGRRNHRRKVLSRPWWSLSPHSVWAVWIHD